MQLSFITFWSWCAIVKLLMPNAGCWSLHAIIVRYDVNRIWLHTAMCVGVCVCVRACMYSKVNKVNLIITILPFCHVWIFIGIALTKSYMEYLKA